MFIFSLTVRSNSGKVFGQIVGCDIFCEQSISVDFPSIMLPFPVPPDFHGVAYREAYAGSHTTTRHCLRTFSGSFGRCNSFFSHIFVCRIICNLGFFNERESAYSPCRIYPPESDISIVHGSPLGPSQALPQAGPAAPAAARSPRLLEGGERSRFAEG